MCVSTQHLLSIWYASWVFLSYRHPMLTNNDVNDVNPEQSLHVCAFSWLTGTIMTVPERRIKGLTLTVKRREIGEWAELTLTPLSQSSSAAQSKHTYQEDCAMIIPAKAWLAFSLGEDVWREKDHLGQVSICNDHILSYFWDRSCNAGCSFAFSVFLNQLVSFGCTEWEVFLVFLNLC